MTFTVSATTLYLDRTLESQRLEILAAEKGDNVIIRRDEFPPDLHRIHPSGTLPLLLDKHLILHGSHLIDSFFEERFPSPALLPSTPIARSKVRFLADQIKGWYGMAGTDLKGLHRQLDEFSEALDPSATWFAGEMFTFIDVAIAPLLTNATSFAYPILPTTPIGAYAARLQKRPSVFSASANFVAAWRINTGVDIEVYH